MKNITIKIEEALALRNKMVSLVEDSSRRFRGNYTLVFTKNYNALKEATKDFDNLQTKLLTELKDKDQLVLSEDGHLLGIKSAEAAKDFNERITDMSSVEVEVSLCTLSESDFESLLNGYEFSVPEVEAIERFL